MDWQCSGLASPVFDLSHHIFSTADIKNHPNVNDFLQVYYKSFSSAMALFKCNPETIFSYNDLSTHWKKFSHFGFFIGCYAVKFCSPKQEKFELDPDKLNSMDDLDKLHVFQLKDEEEYYKKAKELYVFHYVNSTT